MKLNPFKSPYFRKSADFTLDTLEDTQEFARAFAKIFSQASGIQRIGLMGVPKTGKSSFASAFTAALHPLDMTFEHIVLDKPFRLFKKPDDDFHLRHYDAAMLRCAPEEDKNALGSFGPYFRDVNPFGIDLVEHPEQECPEIRDGKNGNFNYLLHFRRVSVESDARKVSVYPAAKEVGSQGFKELISASDDGYRCFKRVLGIPLLP